MKTKALESIERLREGLDEQKKIIENLDLNKSVTQQEFAKICQTQLTMYDAIIEPIKATFPNGKNFQRKPNSVAFEYSGYNVKVCTFGKCPIVVEIKGYENSIYKNEKPRPNGVWEKMVDAYNENQNWKELARICCRHNNCLKNDILLGLWWFRHGRKEFSYTICKEDVEKRSESYKIYLNERKLQKEKMVKTAIEMESILIPALSKYGSLRVSVGDCVPDISMGDFVRQQMALIDN